MFFRWRLSSLWGIFLMLLAWLVGELHNSIIMLLFYKTLVSVILGGNRCLGWPFQEKGCEVSVLLFSAVESECGWWRSWVCSKWEMHAVWRLIFRIWDGELGYLCCVYRCLWAEMGISYRKGKTGQKVGFWVVVEDRAIRWSFAFFLWSRPAGTISRGRSQLK